MLINRRNEADRDDTPLLGFQADNEKPPLDREKCRFDGTMRGKASDQ
jgi:hypothetical protein